MNWTTSRRVWMTSGLDSRDDLQKVLDELVDDAVTLLERRLVRVADELGASRERAPDCELIETSTHITFIMHVPG
ncbi:MAG: hypothetical protein ABR867_06270, partial [Nitrososphaerales archaeon]